MCLVCVQGRCGTVNSDGFKFPDADVIFTLQTEDYDYHVTSHDTVDHVLIMRCRHAYYSTRVLAEGVTPVTVFIAKSKLGSGLCTKSASCTAVRIRATGASQL